MRRPAMVCLVIALLQTAAVPVGASEGPLASGTVSAAGTLAQARWGHTATLLPDGRVVVLGGAGGASGLPLDSVEVWDPAAEGFATMAPALTQARVGHTATLLQDGRVLAVGGSGSAEGEPLASTEVWDPATGESHVSGQMTVARSFHTATLLNDGRVLVVGGDFGGVPGPDGRWPSAEIWDPASGLFTPTGSPSVARSFHTATLLPNGHVLLAGGSMSADLNTTTVSLEAWDPATGEFAEAGSLGQPRAFHTATLLHDGRVLLVGGFCGYYCPSQTATWLWDPTDQELSSAGALVEARATHSATLLPDGRVLIVGGKDWWDLDGSFGFVDVWDPATGEYTAGEGLAEPRGLHTATLLPDGRVLVIGGSGASGVRALAEAWSPMPVATGG